MVGVGLFSVFSFQKVIGLLEVFYQNTTLVKKLLLGLFNILDG